MGEDKQRLFVDIDGTLAVFKQVDTLETLYEKGYFLNLQPHENVVAAVKDIVINHPEIEVNILSAYLTDSKYALQEKNEWLDKYLPEIDQAHRVFVSCGSDKKEGIGGIRSDDFLLDDYTQNLNDWEPPARGIKLLNGINHTRGTWEHDRIRYDRSPADLADGIVSVMRNERRIYDKKINKNEDIGMENEYEDITLHLKYKKPLAINGFHIENDTIKFGSQEELMKFVNGETAYNILDDTVKKRDNEILLFADNSDGEVVWENKEALHETHYFSYGGFDYQIIDKWQDNIGTYVVGQLEADDGTWYAAKVTDTSKQYQGEYEYEFSNDKPTRSEVEDIHLNRISELDIDRHEAEYGADGSKNFLFLNDEPERIKRKSR